MLQFQGSPGEVDTVAWDSQLLLDACRDINRDAKWSRLAMNEGLVGTSALVTLPGDAKECSEGRSFNPRVRAVACFEAGSVSLVLHGGASLGANWSEAGRTTVDNPGGVSVLR